MNDIKVLRENSDFKFTFHDTVLEDKPDLEHTHDEFEIAFFIKADLQIFVKDQQYHIKDGDLLLVGEYEIHKILYTKNTRYTRYVLMFTRKYIEDILKVLDIENVLQHIQQLKQKRFKPSLKQTDEIMHYIKCMETNKDHLLGTSTDNAILKLNLAMLLLFLCECTNKSHQTQLVAGTEEIIRQIIHYLNLHYKEPISLEGIEGEFHLSRYHLCRMFKKYTGFSIGEYVRNKKIIEAQKMLKQTDRSITEICFDCGFQSLQHFFRVFKKLTNTTPYQYKKGLK